MDKRLMNELLDDKVVENSGARWVIYIQQLLLCLLLGIPGEMERTRSPILSYMGWGGGFLA